jgi:hypothetical protein
MRQFQAAAAAQKVEFSLQLSQLRACMPKLPELVQFL